jgi:AmmeMemoRadiSam system protein A
MSHVEPIPDAKGAAVHPHGAELAAWARARLRQALGGPPAVRPHGAWSELPGATFVTLRWPDGRLQGCIGSLKAHAPIASDAAQNAIAAGLRDPRALPLDVGDVDALDLELSILSETEPIPFRTQAEALAAIRPGVDGIVLRWRDHSATFLPIMWNELPDVRVFLAELKQKAGLAYDFWDDDIRLERYTVDKHTDRRSAAGVA